MEMATAVPEGSWTVVTALFHSGNDHDTQCS